MSNPFFLLKKRDIVSKYQFQFFIHQKKLIFFNKQKVKRRKTGLIEKPFLLGLVDCHNLDFAKR